MPQQQFHPISMLPMFSEMIDGMLEMTQGQHRMFSSALAKPHVLDDETVDQARDAFEEQPSLWGCTRIRWVIGDGKTSHRRNGKKWIVWQRGCRSLAS